MTSAQEIALEDFDSVQEDGIDDRIPVQFSHVRFSNSVEAKIATCRKLFFHSLPLEKQIILLRRSEDLPQQSKCMSSACTGLARQLSAELKLKFQTVNSWLVRRYRFLKNIGNSLAPRHIKYLLDEFKLSPVLSDERALLLGHVLQAPVSAIRRWFELKRSGRLKLYRSSSEGATSNSESVCNNFEIIEDGVSDEEPDSSGRSLIEDDAASDLAVNVSNNRVLQVRKPLSKLPNRSKESKGTHYSIKEYQLEILFQAFKRCSNLTPSKAHRLSLQLNIPRKKIYSWFQGLRTSLAKVPSTVLLSSYRNQNLTPEQVEVLESEYQIHTYINKTRLNLLADLLDVEKCLIRKWFLSRRCYDIVFLSNSSSDADDEMCASTPSVPVINLNPTTDDETAVQGSSTPARSEGSHFSDVLDAENFLFSDEGHLSDEPLVEPSSNCYTKDVFKFEDDKEPIIPLVQLRKKSVKSVPSNTSSGVTRAATKSRPKKMRFPLTPFQRTVLCKNYRKSAYITPGEAQQLAVKLRLPVKRIRLWFERMRLRKKNLGTAGDAPKMRGPRMKWPLSAWQKQVLQEEYDQNPRLTKRRLNLLCDKLKASHPTVLFWFREQKDAQK